MGSDIEAINFKDIHILPETECVPLGTVPYIVYEGEQTRNERHIKRLIIALVIAVLLIFATNALWLYAWMQYDYESTETTATTTQTVDVDAKDGTANYIGNNGDIINGADSGDNNYKESRAPQSTDEGE